MNFSMRKHSGYSRLSFATGALTLILRKVVLEGIVYGTTNKVSL